VTAVQLLLLASVAALVLGLTGVAIEAVRAIRYARRHPLPRDRKPR
jgi:hypothetical protein